jgi:hypothetical protein
MIALFRSGRSTFVDRLAGLLGPDARVLDLHAAQRGDGTLAIGDDVLDWQGCDLGRARVLFLEEPVFAWPQPWLEGEVADESAHPRTARALAHSALLAAARAARAVNPLEAGELAAEPLLALDRLARAGLPVAPWELCARPAREPAGPWRDPAGRVAGYRRAAPEAGELAWRTTADCAEPWSCLVVGEALAGAARRSEDHGGALGPEQVPRETAELALRAARTLGLDLLEVRIGRIADGPALTEVLAGPDLEAWASRLGGALERALAEHLHACVP